MKLYATLENENHKVEGIGGNESLLVYLRRGSKLVSIISFTPDKLEVMEMEKGKSTGRN